MKLFGSAVCRCEYPVDQEVETCKLCPGGEDVPDPSISIDAIGETCAFINDLEGSTACQEITRRGLASQCKCPGTSACNLCEGTAGILDGEKEITRGKTCADAQSFVRDMFAAYPKFLGCEPGFADFYFRANVREVCCQGAELSEVEKTALTIPPNSSPTGSDGKNTGNGKHSTDNSDVDEESQDDPETENPNDNNNGTSNGREIRNTCVWLFSVATGVLLLA